MKKDPIRKHYYRPLEIAEASSEWLFYIVAVLSIAILAIEKTSYPRFYDLLQGVFISGVITVFVIGLGIRLYWTPRADDKRRESLLSNSFNILLTHEQTSGYYNNDQINPIRRFCASLLENSFFSKHVILRMAYYERIKVCLYALVWISVLLNRATDLALVAAIAQAIFSEQVISKSIRLEWLRMRFEGVYKNLYRLIQTTTQNQEEFNVHTLEAFGSYETGKAYGGITLSAKVFEKLNHHLSQEWLQIRRSLKI